jgi:peroxiredoxin
MVEKFGGKLAVIGISVDDEPDGIADFAKQTGAKFPLAWDEGQALSRQYEPSTMPTSFIIDKNGVVRFVHSGFHSGEEKEIEQQVQSLL